jgi:hypothetical protein
MDRPVRYRRRQLIRREWRRLRVARNIGGVERK